MLDQLSFNMLRTTVMVMMALAILGGQSARLIAPEGAPHPKAEGAAAAPLPPDLDMNKVDIPAAAKEGGEPAVIEEQPPAEIVSEEQPAAKPLTDEEEEEQEEREEEEEEDEDERPAPVEAAAVVAEAPAAPAEEAAPPAAEAVAPAEEAPAEPEIVHKEEIIDNTKVDGHVDGPFHPISLPTNFESYDVIDQDGFLTLAELIKATGAHENVELAFQASDKDGDGRLTEQEFDTAPWALNPEDGAKSAEVAQEIALEKPPKAGEDEDEEEMDDDEDDDDDDEDKQVKTPKEEKKKEKTKETDKPKEKKEKAKKKESSESVDSSAPADD